MQNQLKKFTKEELKALSKKLKQLNKLAGINHSLREHEAYMANLFDVKNWSTALGLTKDHSNHKDSFLVRAELYHNGKLLNSFQDGCNNEIVANHVFNGCLTEISETSEGCSMRQTPWNDYDDCGMPYLNEDKK